MNLIGREAAFDLQGSSEIKLSADLRTDLDEACGKFHKELDEAFGRHVKAVLCGDRQATWDTYAKLNELANERGRALAHLLKTFGAVNRQRLLLKLMEACDQLQVPPNPSSPNKQED